MSALAFVILTMSAPGATPPGGSDRAGMCDAYDGVAFTFCVAYCEARECDDAPVADDRCMLIRRGFARVTGGGTPPCAASAAARPL